MYLEKHGIFSPEVLGRLFLVDREPRFLAAFAEKFHREFGVPFPAGNLLNADVVRANPGLAFDVVAGNPPWVNFSDLDPALKESLKPWFVSSGLVPNLRKVLLGGARIDLAALVLATVFARNLKPAGKAGFFLPLSLFLNDGAHQTFRKLLAPGAGVSLDRIYDFQGVTVFEGISTRFCWAEFTAGASTRWPVEYFTWSGTGWSRQYAAPVGPGGASLTVGDGSPESRAKIPRIRVEPWQQPRQGINTCGANEVFHFDTVPPGMDPGYFHPLVTAKVLSGAVGTPEKFILLPYRPSGKPLDGNELESAGLGGYFRAHEPRLRSRKGVFLRSAMDKGAWWALVGVGPYCFADFKVVWTAYGSRDFNPKILSRWGGRPWQANQAMQAFIPATAETDARRIAEALVSLGVEGHLRAHRMEGTCNWAQPGRVRRFLDLPGADI